MATKRFEDFQSALGISRSLLSERLGRLVRPACCGASPYKDEVRTRDRYRLTEMGLDLYPVLMALREWGDRYLAEDGPPAPGPPPRLRRRADLELRCSKCGEQMGARGARRPAPASRPQRTPPQPRAAFA